jgi:hypothetical protein
MRARSNRRSDPFAYRPTLEVLESRATPACVATVGDLDGNGTTDLRLRTD